MSPNWSTGFPVLFAGMGTVIAAQEEQQGARELPVTQVSSVHSEGDFSFATAPAKNAFAGDSFQTLGISAARHSSQGRHSS